MIIILSSTKILDKINRLLIEKYPDYTVYIDVCPKDFDRPSFLIELITIRRSPVNKRTVREIVYFSITCFDETDEYSDSNLFAVQQEILNIFKAGYIKVDDRAIAVKASPGGRNFDQAYIDLQFEYFDNLSDEEDTAPKIKDVYIKVKEK